MERNAYAEGVWCTECEFFEVRDIDLDGTWCLACGCHASKHRDVVVVDK